MKNRYSRTIFKIYHENKYHSEKIIKSVYGWWYYQYSNDKNIGILQKKAKDLKIGLWQDKIAIAPCDFRKQQRTILNF